MVRVPRRLLTFVLIVAGSSPVWPAAAQSVVLTGADGRQATLDAGVIAALPRDRVTLDVHGTEHVLEGPRLIDVLAAVGVQIGGGLRGAMLAQAVRVRADDGYEVVLGLGELDAGLSGERVLLADRFDGEALGPDRGPFQLAVEGDARPARAVRNVVAIEVMNLRAGDATAGP